MSSRRAHKTQQPPSLGGQCVFVKVIKFYVVLVVIVNKIESLCNRFMVANVMHALR